MSGDVLPFDVLRSRSNEACVAKLQDLLTLASRGEVLTLACVVLGPSGEFTLVIAGERHPLRLVGGLEVLKQRVMDSQVEIGF